MSAVRIRPTTFVWSGNEMVPMERFRRQCNEQFEVGADYVLTVLEARSRASHSHFFAVLHEAWINLPESIAHLFPTAEHLRAYALVSTDQCTVGTYECVDEATARRLGQNIRRSSPYFKITLRGTVVEVREPISQSAKAMGKDAFNDSKRKVLEFVAGLGGVTPAQLRKEGNRHFPERAR